MNTSTLVSLLTCVLYLILFVTNSYRYRALFWQKRVKFTPSIPLIPYEAYILLVVGTLSWAINAVLPTVSALYFNDEEFQGEFNFMDWKTGLFVLYILACDAIDIWAFKQIALKPYFAMKRASQIALIEEDIKQDSKTITEKHNDTDLESATQTDTNISPEALSLISRIRRLHANMKCKAAQRPEPTATYVLARYHTRLFLKTIVLSSLGMLAPRILSEQPVQYLDATKSWFPLLLFVSTLYLGRSVQVVVEGHKFYKKEVKQPACVI